METVGDLIWIQTGSEWFAVSNPNPVRPMSMNTNTNNIAAAIIRDAITNPDVKLLLLMKGVPGSGKSHKAREIAAEVPGAVVFSTDDFFMQDGDYRFDPSKLGEYHAANQRRAKDAFAAGVRVVIIDNTNLQAWEAKEYVVFGFVYGYAPFVLEAGTPWAKDAEECARRNTHGVPKEAIERMLARWEDFNPIQCLTARAPWEK